MNRREDVPFVGGLLFAAVVTDVGVCVIRTADSQVGGASVLTVISKRHDSPYTSTPEERRRLK